MRIHGRVEGGGRLDMGRRWQDGFFSRTQFVVQEGGCCRVAGTFWFYSGSNVIVGSGADLNLGSGYANNGTTISCFSSISIGDDVAIGPEVQIRDSDSHSIDGSSRPSTLPITIGDHVWLGARVMVMKGVNIGSGAIVAAGAVVTRDVEPRTLVAGLPARFVRHATWSH